MNETDRLATVFSVVLDSYRRMIRVWQGVAFLLLILCMILASCISWGVSNSEIQIKPLVGMSVTTLATGKLLTRMMGKDSAYA